MTTLSRPKPGRATIASLDAPQGRAAAYADPPPAKLHMTERGLRDAGQAGRDLLREARALGLLVTVGA